MKGPDCPDDVVVSVIVPHQRFYIGRMGRDQKSKGWIPTLFTVWTKLRGIPLVLQLRYNMLHVSESVYKVVSDAVLELGNTLQHVMSTLS